MSFNGFPHVISSRVLASLRSPDGLAAFFVALLFGYLISPAFTSTHVEAFTAQTQSLALAVAEGWADRHDIEQPITSQFILTSRSGVIYMLAGIDLLRGVSSDLGYRLLTLVSLLVMIAGSCVFARRWSGTSYIFALLAVTLIPGALSLGFYFNDNVVSAAFVAMALATVGPHSRLSAFAFAGILMAAAVQCRIDAILALPLVALLAPMQRANFRHVSLAAGAFLCGFVPTLLLAALLVGFTPLDGLAVAQLFDPPVASAGLIGHGIKQAILFFGIIGSLIVVLGGAAELKEMIRGRKDGDYNQRRLWRFMLLILYPLAVVIVAIYRASEMRHFYPLIIPVLTLHGARGIQLIAAGLQKSGAQFFASLVFVFIGALVMFLPPLQIQVRDGPSNLLGVAYSPFLWRHWQQLQDLGMARIESVIRKADGTPSAVLITTQWNDDFYLRLRAFESGYRPATTTTFFPGCAGFSVYVSGNSKIIHVRPIGHYWKSPFPNPKTAALVLSSAYSCPAVRNSAEAWMFTFGSYSAEMLQLPQVSTSNFQSPPHVSLAKTQIVAGTRRLILGTEKDPLDDEEPLMPTLLVRRISPAELQRLVRQSTAATDHQHLLVNRARQSMLMAYTAALRPLPVGNRQWSFSGIHCRPTGDTNNLATRSCRRVTPASSTGRPPGNLF